MTYAREGRGWRADVDGTTTSIVLSGDWVARDDGVDVAAAQRILGPGVKVLRFDGASLGQWDSALVAFLLSLRETAKDGGVKFDETGLPQAARRLLTLAAHSAPAASAQPGTPFLDRVGQAALSILAEIAETATMVGNVLLRGVVALRAKAAMRGRDLIEAMYEAGAGALAIVTVVNVLMGGILAFIGASELRQLGAGFYVANLVALGMAREMAALMTAIIMCGRTGGAYAANIAAMQGADEIDALRAFGIPVFDYMILPRVLALTAMMPLLYVYGCVVGIVGGLLVGAATLGVSATSFFVAAQQALSLEQLGFGLAKSLAFGALIAIVACRVGLRADRSAAAVGKAATSAVVAGIVGVIAVDALFDLCANVLGI